MFGVRPWDYAFTIPTRELVFDRNCMRALKSFRQQAQEEAAKGIEDSRRRAEASGG